MNATREQVLDLCEAAFIFLLHLKDCFPEEDMSQKEKEVFDFLCEICFEQGEIKCNEIEAIRGRILGGVNDGFSQ